MTTTTVHQLPTNPTGIPTIAKCSCGKWDFVGLDNEDMRRQIATHLTVASIHGKA